MSRYTTITYAQRTPQARVQRLLTGALPFPEPPPPLPPIFFLISGTVTQNGTAPGFSTGIEFPSVGTIFTATSGSYGLLVQLGYGGTAIPHYSLGEFVPQVRSYGSVDADTPNQDYAYTPYQYVHVVGEVRLDGVPVFGAAVSFSGDGQASSDVSGTYVGTVISGYSGTATLLGYSSPAYLVTPTSRIYSNITVNQNGQDYDVETLLWTIDGVTTSNGTGYSTQITNGIATWNTASDGSYSYLVIGGWSGSTVPTYISDPGSYSYANVQADFFNQDFDIPVPELFYAPTNISWGGWAYTVPSLWRVEVSATGSTAWTFYNYTAGTNFNYSVASSVGSYFRVYGATSGSNQITPPSNVVYAEPPDPGGVLISGALTEDGSPMVGIGVEITSHGTVVTNGAGTYSQLVTSGYSGTVIPHYTNGSFVPQYRVYDTIAVDQLNQDYQFYGTAITDCPVPSTLATIPIDADPKNPSRNVIDPVNNLLWVIDEYYPNVYYIDVVAGTYLGSVATGQSGGSPCIAYDAVNQKIVITTYDGSIGFINPTTKALTFSNFTQRWPDLHMLAVDQYGTVYVADSNHGISGSVYIVDGNTEQLLTSYYMGLDSVYTYSICWAENINRLVLNQNAPFGNRFFLFDPTNGNFSASVLGNGSNSFNYECWYVKGTGHVLMSANGASAVSVIDIINGTDATIIASLTGDVDTVAPTRASDVTEDTCANTVFVSDGNYAVWEYTMDGSYTLLNAYNNGFLGLTQTGLAHSRATNLVYYENYNDGTTYSLPYAQYTISGSITEGGLPLANIDIEFTTFGTTTSTDMNGSYYQVVPVHWNGTVQPHLANGTFNPYYRIYPDVTTNYPNQDYEYFWNGYLFLTEGTSGFVWSNLPNDAVVVDGTIVQLNGDSFVYTSTAGRTDWTLRGFAQDGFRIAYGNVPNRYVVVGAAGQIWSAEDLSVWTSRTSGVAVSMTALTYGDGRFVAGCDNGETTMSTDGTNWAVSSAGTTQINDIYYNGTVYVAVGQENGGLVCCYTSANGTSWTHRNTPVQSWRAGVYSPTLGLNVIVGDNGAVAVSTDAINWTDYTGVMGVGGLNGVAWGNNRFVVGAGFGGITGAVYTSSNGTVWDYVTEDPYFRQCRRALYWKNDWFIMLEEFPPT